MKATIALLPDLETQNVVSALAWELHLRCGLGLDVRRLPPHVSLRQPFEAPHLPDLLGFFRSFTATIPPLTFELQGFNLWPAGEESCVVSLAIAPPDDALRQMHRRLITEMEARFGPTKADFDGDLYEFHVTIASGGAPLEGVRTFVEKMGSQVAISSSAEAASLFLYDRRSSDSLWEYLAYETIRL
jgi:2'-5' RNA ligase